MIRVQSLSVDYRTNEGYVAALKGLSLDIPKKEVTAIVGESGSGKSTLLYSVLRLLPPGTKVKGSIIAEASDVLAMDYEKLNHFRWNRCALILQGAMSSFTPVLSIGNQIAETIIHHRGLSSREALLKTSELLERVGLPAAFVSRYPHELSGGQKQRAAIAMAISCDPDFLLADEPTTALDVITQAEITVLLAELVAEKGMGLCMVTHDLPLALSLCHNLAVMKEGEIVEAGRPEIILEKPRHPHTVELVESIRKLEEGSIAK